MRAQLQGKDLTQRQVMIPDALARAITGLRGDIAKKLANADLETGWTPAYSLGPDDALRTGDFLTYSALTTVARRPGTTWLWTENWPFEPEVGNTPTVNTFRWTWISFCFTFFTFGVVLFIYQFWLNDPDVAPMDPVLAKFSPVTDRMDWPVVDRRRLVPRTRDGRRPGSTRPRSACRPAVVGPADHCRRRADRQLARHHGVHRYGMVLVRKPGALLHPARPFLADRLLRGLMLWSLLVFRGLWPSAAALWQATVQF
jgi:hypothetical protein